MSEATDQPDLLAPAADAKPEREPTIYELLRARHAPPEWAFMEEVAPATGGGTRYADAVAVHLWASRGHEVVGYEVKVSRSDWLRELKQPEKAEPVMRYCDRWFVVTEKDCVRPGELPINWGHMERRGTRLVQVVPAPRLTPEPLTRAFFASLMRRGHEQIEQIAARQHAVALAAARKSMNDAIEEGIRRRTRDNAELAARVKKFEDETGLTLSGYAATVPLAAIRLARRLESVQGWSGDAALGKLAHLATQLEHAAGSVRKAIADTQLEASNETQPTTGA